MARILKVIATLASAGVIAGAAYETLIARRILHPTRNRPTAISHADDSTIVLSGSPIVKQNGTLGFLYNGEKELGVLGTIICDHNTSVRRSFTVHPGSSAPVPGTYGRPVGNVFRDASMVGLETYQVSIATPLGEAPAWIFSSPDPQSSTWAIHLHGILSGREGAFRSVYSLRQSQFTSLVPSIRGDGEGPDSPGRVFTLGQSEWLDVEAAVEFAINQGAQKILLIGWSSGASMALRLAVSSKYKEVISGLVLISPVLNWRNSILHSASNAGVARGAAQIAVTALSNPLISRILGVREPLRFEEINWTERPLERRLPTLVVHSKGDRTAPFGDSHQFAKLNADCVTLVVVEPAEHALEWNADPEKFDAHLQRWLVEQAFLARPVVGNSNVQ